jgi:hypothetical protein
LYSQPAPVLKARLARQAPLAPLARLAPKAQLAPKARLARLAPKVPLAPLVILVALQDLKALLVLKALGLALILVPNATTTLLLCLPKLLPRVCTRILRVEAGIMPVAVMDVQDATLALPSQPWLLRV